MIRPNLSLLAALASTAWATTALAEPVVVADIPPVHSLVAQVMAGVGAPALLVPPGAEPHHVALRPSDAQALATAEVVIWAGPEMTPWLADAIGTLAPTAQSLALLATPGWAPLPVRPAGTDAPDHDDNEHGDDHGDEHADDHGDDHGADAHTADDGHAHAEGTIDPHAWLDPAIAAVWVDHIAETLATADPANAAAYRANAATAQQALASLGDTLAAEVPQGMGVIWPHDAYQYFGARFGVPTDLSVSLTDATPPAPAHVAALRAEVDSGAVGCVLTDGVNARWAGLLIDGTEAKTQPVDDLGATLVPGPDLYADVLRGIAAALASCR